MWGGFAFGVLGAALAALFLRNVGIVGHTETSDEELTTVEAETANEKTAKRVSSEGGSTAQS